ncbi:hypothetical protein [Alteromonas oceanisediminis]|nr:hypothetical protein [Alteromonas oceanisediminis]MBT0584988.1 hypothetical protein [Alteromonas oceanisediminis]
MRIQVFRLRILALVSASKGIATAMAIYLAPASKEERPRLGGYFDKVA